ncbi:IS3 family transposase [Photobacterium rosenbergii]|uniref:IS3 family transposase n=1 Tax=Photobacterium rosenbergii TaxID=294936 RepID=A0ABU3ZPR0_9GAMM|nr:IS3 family transposase [Photobacterium rosenbergii]MDV5172111.1 IS3 family transposase [Photobacterium rosenbergii]
MALTLKNKYPLKHLLRALNLARSVFYYQVKASKCPDIYENERLLVQSIYHEHKGRYGYRRVHLELRKRNIMLNHKTVQKLMAQLSLKPTVRPKKYRSYRGECGNIAPNVLERDFSAAKPDEKWVTDVTEFKVKGQKVYLSPVVDLFTREVITYKVAKNAGLPLVTDMLAEAISKLEPESKPIIHSDQGWQYRHRTYQKQMIDNGLVQSMSRKGNCLDNAVAENFFALLKTEMYHNRSFEDANDLIEQIKEYIKYYNTKRIKTKLKGLTPIEYRNQALKVA